MLGVHGGTSRVVIVIDVWACGLDVLQCALPWVGSGQGVTVPSTAYLHCSTSSRVLRSAINVWPLSLDIQQAPGSCTRVR